MNMIDKQVFQNLSIEQIKSSLFFSFSVYKKLIESNSQDLELSQAAKVWCAVHDCLSWFYGYYGDLDLYIDDYEKTLCEKVYTLEKKSQFDDLIDEINEMHLQREKRLSQMKEEGWNIIEM